MKRTPLLKAITKPRKFSVKDKQAIIHAGRQNMIQDIEELEQRAHHLGCHVTAQAINRAKNALGWEIAGELMQAAKAARGER